MKLYKILIASFLILGVISCQDALDIDPPGILDDEATFQSTADLRSYLNGIYRSASNTTEIAFSSTFTDELAPAPGYNGRDRDLHRFVLNSDNGYASGIWSGNYFLINRVNRLLNGATLFTPAASEVAEYNNILAEARTLRAYAYLTLLSYFSTDMTNDNALGVIIVDGVPEISAKLPRSSNGDCFAVIEADLNFAEGNLSASNDYFHATLALVDAIRARMYAYRGMYTQAETYANNVINNYGLTLTAGTPYVAGDFYADFPTTPYRQVWADNFGLQHEIIFGLDSPATGSTFSPASLFYFNSTKIDGSPIWGMGLNLYAELTSMTDDVRALAFVDPSSDLAQNAVMIDKYPGIISNGLANDLKLFRLSEMYLILAEVAASNGDYPGAAGFVHEVQMNRTTNAAPAMPTYSSPVQAWKGILDERRKELCFEGHRYVDLKRLGQLAGTSIDRSTFDDENPSLPTTLPITDHRFTLPIPLAEIQGNPTIEQNPGY